MSPPANRPAAPRWNRPSGAQTGVAFGVAIVVLATLLVSALFGIVPQQFVGRIFQLAIAVAGAGFTLFLLGYFDWHRSDGLRIGGPLGVFVLLMILNPGKDVPEYLSEYLNKSFHACRENIQSGQYDVAEADCANAAYELPESGAAMHWLALSQYHQERYNDAITSWKRALRLGYEPARIHYNIAFANFQLGRYGAAAKEGMAAVEASATNLGLRARSWFLIADAELSLWNFGAGPDQHFINATQAFQSFIEIGSPKYKAQAELACILAVKAELITLDSEKEQFEAEAIDSFRSALSEITAHSKRNSEFERSSFVMAYEPAANRCGAALSDLWKKKRPEENYNGLLIKMRD